MRCWLMLLLVGATAVQSSEGLVSKSHIGAVASVARQLARAGHDREARELVKWVVRAGVPDSQRVRLTKDVSRLLAKAKKLKTTPSVKGSIRRLQQTAAQLATGLPETANASGRTLARFIVALDSSQPEANRVLGHKLYRGDWVPVDRITLLKRRGEIADAIKRARKIKVKLRRIQSAVFKRIGRAPTRAISWGEDDTFVVHTTEVGEEAVRRVMTETLRAAAVSNWLWTGDLEIPVPLRSLQVALCGAEETYHKWVRYSRDRQNDDVKIDMELVSCSRAGYEIYRPQTEVRWMVTAIEDYLICTSVDAFGCRIQPVLFGGHLHWLCLSYLREPGPWHLFSQADLKKGTAGTARMTAERKRLMGLKRESLSGLRAWMMYLVNGAEDPPWQKAILDEIGRIEDDEDLLLKATSMAAFLQERGEFNKLASKTRKVIGSDAKRRVAMLDALGRPFAGLERQWREWLLPGRGVAQRLSAKRGN